MSKLTNYKGLAILLVILVLPISQSMAWQPKVRESMAPKALQARMAPIGQVEVDGDRPVVEDPTAVVLGPGSGKKRYDKSCVACHGTGIAGSPKFRVDSDWSDRISLGIEGLLASAIKGKGGMPPKGTCMSCSDEELKLAIEYMLPQ